MYSVLHHVQCVASCTVCCIMYSVLHHVKCVASCTVCCIMYSVLHRVQCVASCTVCCIMQICIHTHDEPWFLNTQTHTHTHTYTHTHTHTHAHMHTHTRWALNPKHSSIQSCAWILSYLCHIPSIYVISMSYSIYLCHIYVIFHLSMSYSIYLYHTDSIVFREPPPRSEKNEPCQKVSIFGQVTRHLENCVFSGIGFFWLLL